jgi:hypothetical protein
MNLYAYADVDPVNETDPTGLATIYNPPPPPPTPLPGFDVTGKAPCGGLGGNCFTVNGSCDGCDPVSLPTANLDGQGPVIILGSPRALGMGKRRSQRSRAKQRVPGYCKGAAFFDRAGDIWEGDAIAISATDKVIGLATATPAAEVAGPSYLTGQGLAVWYATWSVGAKGIAGIIKGIGSGNYAPLVNTGQEYLLERASGLKGFAEQTSSFVGGGISELIVGDPCKAYGQ